MEKVAEVHRGSLLWSSLCREVCEELVARCVSDMVRESVNACIEDIVRR